MYAGSPPTNPNFIINLGYGTCTPLAKMEIKVFILSHFMAS